MSLTVAAAPRGTRVGFTAAGDRQRQLLISVLPKTWRSGPRALFAFSDTGHRHHHVVLHETDRLHLSGTHSALEVLLTECLTVARRDDDAAPRWDSSLLAPDVPPRPAELDQAREPVTTDDLSNDLLLLFDRLDLLLPRSESLRGHAARSPIHRPLVYRRFLDEVQGLAGSARRGYRPTQRTGGVVRGRIEPASLIRHQAVGDPRLTCRFDELTESTVLLGVICAGLEYVADGHGRRSPFAGRHAEQRLRHDAVTLRRTFAEVAALPPAQARIAGGRLRLGRLDQRWTDALRLAVAILGDAQFTAHHAGPQLVDAVELSIPTDRLWERILHHILHRAGFDPVLQQHQQPAGVTRDPWISDTGAGANTRPDNVAWRSGELWVVDAKYKLDLGSGLPGRADQYQMFAYSHLVRHEGSAPDHLALVHPGQPAAHTWRRGRDVPDHPRRLHVVGVPFPTPAEVRTPHSWQSYLDVSGALLRAQIDGIPATDRSPRVS